jgi:hypothetical protein
LDANHFRSRAAKARALARGVDDALLAKMVVDVAMELDAEAEAIEAEQRASDPQGAPSGRPVRGDSRN